MVLRSPEIPPLLDEDEYRRRIGQRLKEARARAGVPQQAVVELLGVGPNALTHWENGKALPKADQLGHLADLYHCSLDWLIGRPGSDDVYLICPRARKIVAEADTKRRLVEALSYLTFAAERDSIATTDPKLMWHEQAEALRRLKEIEGGTEG